MPEKQVIIKHNCEKAIIGAMIQDPNWLTVSKKYLEDIDFACDSSRVIFQFLKKLESQNKRWDKTILKEYIPLLPVQINNEFVEECISLCIDTNHCPDYLKEIKDTSIMRKLLEETKKIGAEQEGIAIKDMLEQYRTKMDILLNELPSDDDFNLTTKLLDVMDEMEENRKEGSKAIKTGFDSFDKFWGGVKPKRLYCIGARPGVGKTSWHTKH